MDLHFTHKTTDKQQQNSKTTDKQQQQKKPQTNSLKKKINKTRITKKNTTNKTPYQPPKKPNHQNQRTNPPSQQSGQPVI